MNFLTSVLFVMFVPLQIQIHIAKMFGTNITNTHCKDVFTTATAAHLPSVDALVCF